METLEYIVIMIGLILVTLLGFALIIYGCIGWIIPIIMFCKGKTMIGIITLVAWMISAGGIKIYTK